MKIKVSDRRSKFLDQLQLNNIYDIINYLPKRYVDLKDEKIDITKHNNKITLLCKISSEVIFKRIRNKLSKTRRKTRQTRLNTVVKSRLPQTWKEAR